MSAVVLTLKVDIAGTGSEGCCTQIYYCFYNNTLPRMKNRHRLQCSTQDDKVKPWQSRMIRQDVQPCF